MQGAFHSGVIWIILDVNVMNIKPSGDGGERKEDLRRLWASAKYLCQLPVRRYWRVSKLKMVGLTERCERCILARYIELDSIDTVRHVLW